MLKDQNPVAQEKFIELLKKEKVPYTVQTGFIRVEGPRGRRMYVANTQKVRRVDISGFELQEGGVKPAGGKNGRVMQQLDFSQDEDTVLRNFQEGLRYMKSLPPSETARDLPNREKGGELASVHVMQPRPSAPPTPPRQQGRRAAEQEIPTLGEEDGRSNRRTQPKRSGGGGGGRNRNKGHHEPRPSAPH